METCFANQRLLQGSFGRLNAYDAAFRKRGPRDTEEQLHDPQLRMTRRGFLRASVVHFCTPGSHLDSWPRFPRTAASAQAQTLALTPECADAGDLTPQQTEGPYFTRNSPETASLLEAGTGGTRLSVSGTVLSASCQPISGALLDFWQADDQGQYDNVGYRLRGHQFTDARGSIQPRNDCARSLSRAHPPYSRKSPGTGCCVLTTQLYFAGEPGNQRDGISARS